MRRSFASVIAAVLLALWTFGCTSVSSTEDSLRSKVRYLDNDFFRKNTCQWKSGPSFQQGSHFLDAVSGDDVRSIDMPWDWITLPAPLVIQFLAEGRFDNTIRSSAIGTATTVRVRLMDGNCFQFNVHVDPATRKVSSIDTIAGRMTVPTLPEKCRILEVPVKLGMTRAEVESTMDNALGMSSAFVDERYVVRNSACGSNGQVLNVELAFKPANKNDSLGRFPKESSGDVVIRISPEYLGKPVHFHP